jgi:hypothetical protein
VSDLLELPFDQYQRYRLASDLLRQVRPNGKTWRVLDVGGRTALLRRFLPEDSVSLVDLEPSGEKGLVLGDGAKLPFADRSFDVVTAFDTLEHVPPPLRDAFVAECRRVARSYVAIVGPYAHPDVDEAERLVQVFLKEKLAVEHRYLDEHRHHGLPDRRRVEEDLRARGAEVRSYGHGNLERWLALICLTLYMDYTDELRIVAARFFRFYNKNLYASDHAEPVYRHVVLGAFDGARLPTVEGILEPAVMPAGAVARMTEVAFELALFERAHELVHEEREEFRKVVAELQRDLAGHQTSLASWEAEGRRREEALHGAISERDRARAELETLARDLGAKIAEQDAKITELRAALHGRLKNLARALLPKPIP